MLAGSCFSADWPVVIAVVVEPIAPAELVAAPAVVVIVVVELVAASVAVAFVVGERIVAASRAAAAPAGFAPAGTHAVCLGNCIHCAQVLQHNAVSWDPPDSMEPVVPAQAVRSDHHHRVCWFVSIQGIAGVS